MSITIENPTAESALEALRQLPEAELEKLRVMLLAETPVVDENTEWSDQDLTDFSLAGAELYEEIEAEEVNLAPTR